MTWRPSIRLFVPLVLVTPILAVTAALVTLSTITGERVAADLAEQWVTGATSHVGREVRDFLTTAVNTSDRYARRIERGSLPVDDLWSWRGRLVDDLATTPELASIAFADAGGDALWLRRAREGFELAVVDGGSGIARVFRVDPRQPEAAEPLRTFPHDPRDRPWYEAAVAQGEPSWTPIETGPGATESTGGGDDTPAVDDTLGAGYTRVLRAGDGAPLGVLAVDVALRGLSDFLRRSPVARQGFLFVLDDTGHLVAASDGQVVSPRGERLMPMQSSSLAAQSLAALLGQPQPADDVYRVRFRDGTRARVTLTPIHPYPGIRWRIATVVPESVFLEDVRASQQRATMIAIVAALGAVVLGLILARHIVEPILRLRAHTQRIGAGQLDARLELRSARELEELAADLNRMAAGLRDALQVTQALAVADEVQHSLLPESPPRIDGLDIAGLARYCDATGGDYFDFIEVMEGPRKRVIVAVGDVMGHGVAAALLMATARAALRAAAAGGGSLGELTSRVNDVLARDARHGRFMTLALAIVEPETRTLRWASAGHDAPIVVDPAAAVDGPSDAGAPTLDGGDLPLGIESAVAYAEYAVSLPRGAVVLIGTDGIWEARDAEGRMFGKPRLRSALRAAAAPAPGGDPGDAGSIADAVRAALADFVGPAPLRDDFALVVLKLR